jgi:predicted dehydrogenase
MKILVVGSGGVGAAFAPIAARRDFFEHIVFADIDASRGRRVVDRYDVGSQRRRWTRRTRRKSQIWCAHRAPTSS